MVFRQLARKVTLKEARFFLSASASQALVSLSLRVKMPVAKEKNNGGLIEKAV